MTDSLSPLTAITDSATASLRPRVVIIGAGFGGLAAARQLGGQHVDVLIIDRNNYHGFWPLLYQVALSGLEAESIAYPARRIFRDYKNLQFRLGIVIGVDFEQRLVRLEGGDSEPYDSLIIAAGSANNYFGNDALASETYGLKDLDEALELRHAILKSLEKASHTQDLQEQAALLTFVIIGAGPTGVELAGTMAELGQTVLRRDFPMIDNNRARVILIEAGSKVLGTFPESLQRNALYQLERRGVEVMLNKPVLHVENDIVTLKDNTQIRSCTVIWAAGVRGAYLADALDTELARGARVKVTPTLNLPNQPEVFVIGDMAYLEGFQGKNPYPMVAPVAIQQGKLAAKNILARMQGRAPRTFRYLNKGQMATIGRRSAVFDSYGIRLTGLFAWLGWLFVHLMMLVGFRNRLVVFMNWAYNYFTYSGAVPLIIEPEDLQEAIKAGRDHSRNVDQPVPVAVPLTRSIGE